MVMVAGGSSENSVTARNHDIFYVTGKSRSNSILKTHEERIGILTKKTLIVQFNFLKVMR